MLDVRVPIGWLFIVYGALLVAWALYKPVLTNLSVGHDIDLNLVWGSLMGVFGLMMKLLSLRDARKTSEQAVVTDIDNKDKLH
ncbi:MAG: hypothetical protein P4L53_10210 [Candidatus Obscuribacterales bacterium]|nr:hypothetical protein [Candidatus Obscuribacterales bacterium]